MASNKKECDRVHAESSKDTGLIQGLFNFLSPDPTSSDKAPTKKRARSSVSPIGTASAIDPDHLELGIDAQPSPRSALENLPLELDADTPKWAQTMVRSIQKLLINIDRDHSQAIEFATDTAVGALSIANVNKININEQKSLNTRHGDQIQKLIADNEILREKVTNLESYSRRDNLLFKGIAEKPGEKCGDTVAELIKLTGHNPDEMKLVRSHRLGKPGGKQARPIITRFHYFGDRQRVYQSRKKLERSNIYISEDFPPEVVAKRRQLIPILKAAKKLDRYSSQSWISGDKLFINGKPYTVNTLSQLPDDLNPQNLSVNKTNGVCVFFGKSTPLSNHHPSQFTLGRRTYSCVEQYLMVEKATLFKNKELVSKIMKMDNPVEMKRAGYWKNIDGYIHDNWLQSAPGILEKALHAKFTQNDNLLNFLLSTGSDILGEATDNPFWGIGMRVNDPKAHSVALWKNNLMGKTLTQLRDGLK